MMNDIDQAERAVREVLQKAYGQDAVRGDEAFVKAGMSVKELVRMYALIREHDCRSAVEVGMGSGTSSVVICKALQENGGGCLISIDPFQNTQKEGFDGKGIQSLRSADLDRRHRLLEQPDYLALPQLVAEGVRCDFVLIDGWHSFDYTLLDLFYADLLLNDGGLVAFHDTYMPCVYRAVRFLEAHKPYERLSPAMMPRLRSLPRRFVRRMKTFLSGPAAVREARERREDWYELAVYRKKSTEQVNEDHALDF